MSQMPPPPPPPAVRRRRTVFVGTPGRLRVAGVVGVVFCLAFALGATSALINRSDAITNARNHAAQLVRIQDIRSNLAQADAASTNAFLVGGLEPTDQRASYDAGIAGATTAIASASAGSNADAPDLAKTNQLLAQYAGLIESARANNRQGFPIGSAYLRQASNLLRLQMLPPLARLVTAEQARVTSAYNDAAISNDALTVSLALAIVALLLVQIWLSAKTRRTFNLGLVAATLIVVVAALVGEVTMSYAQHKSADVRHGALANSDLLATARTDAFDAKSDESLTLINRGSGQAFETQYKQLIVDADEILRTTRADPQLAALLDAYDTAHKTVRVKDDGGDWDGAVGLATSGDETGAKAAFAVFDTSSRSALATQASKAADGLNKAEGPLTGVAVLMFLAGIAAAVLAWRGIAVRLREYR